MRLQKYWLKWDSTCACHPRIWSPSSLDFQLLTSKIFAYIHFSPWITFSFHSQFSLLALSLDLDVTGSEFFQFFNMGKAIVIRKGNWRKTMSPGQSKPLAHCFHQSIPLVIDFKNTPHSKWKEHRPEFHESKLKPFKSTNANMYLPIKPKDKILVIWNVL